MDRLIFVLLALAVTLPVAFKSRRSAQHAAPAAFVVQSSSRTLVRVTGDVQHPGIYLLDANLLTDDAIMLAVPAWQPKRPVPGGSGSLPLSNGADIRVIKHPDASIEIHRGIIPAAQSLLLGIPLDLNAMDAADFERIPGIGPVLAQRIVDYRQNNGGKLAKKDLLWIEGIGEKKYNRSSRYFK